MKSPATAAGARRSQSLGAPPKLRAVALVGFMGAGKTSVGRALSKLLGWTFADLDDQIERRERRTVAEIFRASGESGFRRAEHAALKELLDELQVGVKKIVALGGGAFVQNRNARLIEAAGIPAVFLDAEVEELWQRCNMQVEKDGIERPLLADLGRFRRLYDARRPHYLRARFRHETGGKNIREIAIGIIGSLGLNQGSGPRGEKH